MRFGTLACQTSIITFLAHNILVVSIIIVSNCWTFTSTIVSQYSLSLKQVVITSQASIGVLARHAIIVARSTSIDVWLEIMSFSTHTFAWLGIDHFYFIDIAFIAELGTSWHNYAEPCWTSLYADFVLVNEGVICTLLTDIPQFHLQTQISEWLIQIFVVCVDIKDALAP